jgi:YgiT-type zinc finger domain-containing protein
MKNGKTQVKIKNTDRPKMMELPCSVCGGEIQRKAISQEFEREGVKITISGFKSWACSSCGEIYFEPGSVDKLAQAANSLFALAATEKRQKSKVLARVS